MTRYKCVKVCVGLWIRLMGREMEWKGSRAAGMCVEWLDLIFTLCGSGTCFLVVDSVEIWYRDCPHGMQTVVQIQIRSI